MAPLLIALLVAVVLVPAASAQDMRPKNEPAAMSSSYNPLMWRGDVADFAVYTEHISFCQAAFSKDLSAKLTDNNLLSAARLSATEHERIYRKLKAMARALGFEFPPKSAMQDCPEWRKAQSLDDPELTQSWLTYLSSSNKTAIRQFETLIAKPEEPANSGIRHFAEKTLPALQELQSKLNAGEDRTPRPK